MLIIYKRITNIPGDEFNHHYLTQIALRTRRSVKSARQLRDTQYEGLCEAEDGAARHRVARRSGKHAIQPSGITGGETLPLRHVYIHEGRYQYF